MSAYIAKNGKPAACGYCGIDPEKADVRCIPFDDLTDVIGDGTNWAYTSAANEGIPNESAEGGYAFPEHMFDTYDLVVDQVGLEVQDDVLKDVLRACLIKPGVVGTSGRCRCTMLWGLAGRVSLRK